MNATLEAVLIVVVLIFLSNCQSCSYLDDLNAKIKDVDEELKTLHRDLKEMKNPKK